MADLAQTAPSVVVYQEDNLLLRYLMTKRTKNTRRAYLSDLEQFFGTSHIDLELVRQCWPEHINAHLETLKLAGARTSTLRRRLSAIRDFFEWLLAYEYIDKNPAARKLVMDLPSPSRRRVIFLTEQEARRLVTTAAESKKTGTRDYALILTMLYGWLRRSEMEAMNFEDIEPLGGYWIIRLSQTKSGDEQYVKVPVKVVEAIERVKHDYGFSVGPVWRNLSNNAYGSRLSGRSIFRIVQRVALRAGLGKKIGAHSMRHTGCTLALEGGASVPQVQAQARHSSPNTTSFYLHQRDFLGDNAADYIHV